MSLIPAKTRLTVCQEQCEIALEYNKALSGYCFYCQTSTVSIFQLIHMHAYRQNAQ